MSLLRSFYDVLNEALLEDAQTERDEARDAIMRIAHEVGVDLTDDPEEGDVWSQANVLRVVRAVQGLRTQLAMHRGLGSVGQSVHARQVPMAARGW